jgi:hypothetical protein
VGERVRRAQLELQNFMGAAEHQRTDVMLSEISGDIRINEIQKADSHFAINGFVI